MASPDLTARATGGADVSTARLAAEPERIIKLHIADMYAISLEAQREIQLQAAQMRFQSLVSEIPILTRLAEEQGVKQIAELQDLGTLLTPHSALKSYPLSYLENGRYDKLTAWLNNFTSHDLSTIDVGACETLDDWIVTLDENSPVRVIHSTGTGGKLSFLPRGEAECHLMAVGYVQQFQVFGDEMPLLGKPVEETPILYLQYRYGGYSQMRILDALEEDVFGGNKDMIFALNPGRFSAESVSLAGRLRHAESRGELGKLKLSPKLMERRDAAIRERDESETYLNAFLDGLNSRFRGKTVALLGHVPQLHRVAQAGLARGYENMFAPDSFCPGGGGFKGSPMPDDWRETVSRFLGPMREPMPGYGMSEQTAATRICPQGHYHVPPWQIPFVLDPETGEQMPRSGTHTGRYGVFDLNLSSSWGGFLTGDEVTLSFGDDMPCACGRIGAYLHHLIRRYSDKEGGDDKVTCAGAPQAYDRALDYIIHMGA